MPLLANNVAPTIKLHDVTYTVSGANVSLLRTVLTYCMRTDPTFFWGLNLSIKTFLVGSDFFSVDKMGWLWRLL
jgi:hypothetical protein